MTNSANETQDNTLATLPAQSVLVATNQMAKAVEDAFNLDANLIGVIIIDALSGKLVGMVSRKRFMELYSKPFRKELYGKKSLKVIVESDFDAPLCLDETDKIDHAATMGLSRPVDQMYEPIVVRGGNGSLKLVDTHALLLELAKVHERQSMELQETLSHVKQLNDQLEESQKRILESLDYASVIQEAILPRKDLFNQLFKEWFTLYQPRDIVGGDLYWLRAIDGTVLLAVIDCTGHGVPGAFVTMIANSVLNHIVDTVCFDDPARILAEMNQVLHKTLHLRCDGDSTVDAGLDIVLCCIDIKRRELTYAGAGLSLFIVVDGELSEIRGGRAGIGYSGSNPDYRYTNQRRALGGAATLYATTDGFFDQSGGPLGFGFGRERFKEMVAQHAHLPVEEQRRHFGRTLAQWRGERDQRDDVTVVAVSL